MYPLTERTFWLTQYINQLVYVFSSVQFSRSVVSDTLRPHGPQHARPPCPSPTPGVYTNWGLVKSFVLGQSWSSRPHQGFRSLRVWVSSAAERAGGAGNPQLGTGLCLCCVSSPARCFTPLPFSVAEVSWSILLGGGSRECNRLPPPCVPLLRATLGGPPCPPRRPWLLSGLRGGVCPTSALLSRPVSLSCPHPTPPASPPAWVEPSLGE